MNKSIILLKNILQNTQTLQLHTMIIKTEKNYTKVIKNAKLEGWGAETGWSN
jgi:hypothetical protein